MQLKSAISWRSPIGPTQSDLMIWLSWLCFSPVSVTNELTAQYSNTWLSFTVAHFRNPPPSPAPPCIDRYRWIHVCYIWGCFRYMCSSSISHMLTAACCGCFGSSNVSVLALPQQKQRSRSIPSRPIHKHGHVHYHANPSKSCHDRNYNII